MQIQLWSWTWNSCWTSNLIRRQLLIEEVGGLNKWLRGDVKLVDVREKAGDWCRIDGNNWPVSFDSNHLIEPKWRVQRWTKALLLLSLESNCWECSSLSTSSRDTGYQASDRDLIWALACGLGSDDYVGDWSLVNGFDWANEDDGFVIDIASDLVTTMTIMCCWWGWSKIGVAGIELGCCLRGFDVTAIEFIFFFFFVSFFFIFFSSHSFTFLKSKIKRWKMMNKNLRLRLCKKNEKWIFWALIPNLIRTCYYYYLILVPLRFL